MITGRMRKKAKLFAKVLGIEGEYKIHIRLTKPNGIDGGECQPLNDREVEIRVDKGTHKYWRNRALAHEMVHAAQYLRGDLKGAAIKGVEVYNWKGSAFVLKENEMNDDYWLAPWEIEARGMEEYLLHRWRTR